MTFLTFPVLVALASCYTVGLIWDAYLLYRCFRNENHGKEVVRVVSFSTCFTLACMFWNMAYYAFMSK